MNRLSIYLLTVGTFLAGTAEYLIAGVVDMIPRDLQVPLSLAGQLVTVFALAYAIGPPILQQFSVLNNRKIMSGYFVTLFWIAGYATAYTFVNPILRETAHMNTSAISMTMLGCSFQTVKSGIVPLFLLIPCINWDKVKLHNHILYLK